MSSLIVSAYAGKPDPKPKKPPTPENHVILSDPETGHVYWEGDTDVTDNKVGIGVRVYFRNKDPNAEEYSVKFIGVWPGILAGGTEEEPITVIGSDHIAVNIWWERAKQIQLARMSLAFFDAGGAGWLLKAQGTVIVEDSDDVYIITFDGFSLTESGDSIGPYEPLVPPLDVKLSFSSNR
jgi:hypothetical protein